MLLLMLLERGVQCKFEILEGAFIGQEAFIYGGRQLDHLRYSDNFMTSILI